MRWLCVPALLLALLLSSCAAFTPEIVVADPWVRAAAAGANSAAYMRLTNEGRAGDRLLAVASDAAAAIELHETTMEGDVMRMAPLPEGIPVPANAQTELRPGGLHVMLLGLDRDLQDGDRVQLQLTFERSGVVTVDAPVRAP
jgi:hypothetical protein